MSSFGEEIRADVVFHAQTADAQNDIERFRRASREAFSSMSTDALRLAAAQDKYDATLKRHPGNLAKAREAEIRFRREIEQVTSAANRETVALDRTGRELGQVTRGAVVGSGALRGLGRSAAFLSASFLGGAGVVYAVRSAIKAAAESERVLGQTENAVKRAGLSWDQYGKQIADASLAQANLSGFDDERLLQTFSLFVRRTKDVNEALRLNALAANVARGRNIELEQASQLVLKASLGQAGALRRVGIDAEKGASAVELLSLLQRNYAGSVEKYTNTAAGAQARFNVVLENTKETLAGDYLPAITAYLNRGSDWLSQTGNQERLQRDLNTVIDNGAAVARGLAGGLEEIHSITSPLVGVVGGLEHAVRLLLIAMAVNKVRAFVTGLGAVGPAATVAATEVAAADAKIGAAGVTAGVGAGRVGGLAGALKTLGAIGVVTVGVDLLLRYKADEGVNGDLSAVSDDALAAALAKTSSGGLSGDLRRAIQAEVLRRAQAAIAAGYAGIEGARSSPEAFLALTGYADNPLLGGRASIGPGPLTTAQQRRVALARTAGAGTPDEVAAVRAQAEYDRRALAFLQQRRAAGKVSGAKYVEQYEQLYGDLVSREQRLAAIAGEKADAAKAAAKKHAEARAKLIESLIPDSLSGRGVAAGAFGRYQAAGAAKIGGTLGAYTSTVPDDLRQSLIGGITGVPQVLDLQTQIAEARFADHEEKLLPYYRRELKALEQNMALLKKMGAGRVAILQERLAQEQLKGRIRGIQQQDSQATTVADLRAAALSDLQTYGGNTGGPLSPQDARAGFSALILRELREIRQHSHRTADATTGIRRDSPQAIHAARALAGIS